MPVLKTTSAATSVSAPKDCPIKTEPSSSASAASREYSEAIAIHDLALRHSQEHGAAQRLAAERRVLALRQEPLRIDDPGLIRIEHDHVGRRAWLQRSVRQT